ncbi:hypothetical protein [Tropicimonas sediminicola]|uniref:Uncharacterized protein n=1 Tax=Tropicimonas sediminicola TaxID=1031541 RepID=A0A239DFZ8_9RHOB|nr:hypothetical protein [Tropicimonas sediminicola]SNS30942.1 hypothetical protein SAMN05421757_101794 [Tropicimonas sediminicola]
MPYVEVWVDECDGTCGRATQQEKTIRETIQMLRDGQVDDAIRKLGLAIDDKAEKREVAKENELRGLYHLWLAEPIPRPEFFSFAHSKRQATAA